MVKRCRFFGFWGATNHWLQGNELVMHWGCKLLSGSPKAMQRLPAWKLGDELILFLRLWDSKNC